MRIRSYQEADIERIQVIDTACFSTPWTKESWADTLKSEQYHCFVLEQNETIEGFILISMAADEGELIKIGTLPQARGNGYGKALLLRAIQDWKEQGVTYIFLEVRISNQVARALYESLDFHEVGIRKNYYNKPVEDAVIYQKNQKIK